MLNLLARNWWLFAIRGVLAVLFGVFAFVQPEITLTVLVAFLAAYLLVDGVTLLISLVRGDTEARRSAWSVGIMGILGVAAGIAAFVWPDITALTLLFVLAFWAISMGVFQVLAAIRLRREIEGELWMAIGGLLSIAFAAFLLFDPEAGLLSLVWLVGIWAVAFGITNLVLAWRLRTFHGDAAELREAAGAP
jgi:uncharacterized membrane protein HdeD (DUF308 family)